MTKRDRRQQALRARRSQRLSNNLEPLEVRRLLSAAVARFVGPVLPANTKATTTASNASKIVSGQTIIPATDISLAKKTDGAVAYTQYQIQAPVLKKGETYNPYSSTPLNNSRTPQQIRTSYGVTSLTWGAVTGDGSGQTIALIDAFDNPSFVSSTDPNWGISDLVQFDKYWTNQGNTLQDPPSFKKVNQTGGTSYPTFNANWGLEIALDVEWAHAMAPAANIILVEASSNATSNLLAAMNNAKNMAGVTAISMSYGGGESLSQDSSYLKTGVSFFASSGDVGGVLSYPSSSQNVVGVGGTTLNQSSSAGGWLSETAWSSSGGGTSTGAKPDYQNLVTTPSTTKRTDPDVAAVGNNATGVAVMDSSQSTAVVFNADHVTPPASPWVSGSVGGTSLSSPLWAGFMSDVNQGRNLMGLSSLSGRTESLPRLYELAQSDFHDITSGSAGSFSAGPGYDQITGRGTPTPNLYKDLAGGANVTGQVFVDKNDDGVFDGNDTGISGVTVYGDINGNGVYDSGINERTAVTDANGNYTLSDYVGGISITVRATSVGGYFATTSLAQANATVYNTTNNVGFGFFPNSLTGSAFTLKLSGSTEQIFTTATATGSPEYSVALSTIASGYTLNATGGSDTLNIDLSGDGVPIPAGNITYANTSASDSVIVTGSDNADVVSVDNSNITISGLSVSYGAAGTISLNLAGGDDTLNYNDTPAAILFNAGTGSDTLNVMSGSWTFNTDAKVAISTNLTVNVADGATATFNTSQHLASLSTAGSGKVIVPAGGDKVVVTKALDLSGGGVIDLNDNDMIVDYSEAGVSPLASITGWITNARDGGAWDQNGLSSSSAKNQDMHNTTLGAMTTADYYAARGIDASFDGETTNNQEVVIKYTYYGDANFNGKVDGGDYARADASFGSQATGGNIGGWLNGDFNYDGKVNGSDYSLIDAAFNSQLGVL